MKKGLRYSHRALIDHLVVNPFLEPEELAELSGYTVLWVRELLASPAFKQALAERRDELMDPVMRDAYQELHEKAQGVCAKALGHLEEKLDKPTEEVSDQLALQAFVHSARALGMGSQREPSGPTDDVATGLIRHADNLVQLLRRERTRIVEATDGEIEGRGTGEDKVP